MTTKTNGCVPKRGGAIQRISGTRRHDRSQCLLGWVGHRIAGQQERGWQREQK
jgi:hypothetical protein